MDDQQKQDNLNIKVGRWVKETLETEGWKKVIGPILDKMIEDVIGTKKDGRWDAGSFGDKRLTEAKAQNLLWYRQALIEFHERVMDNLDIAKNSKDSKKQFKVTYEYKVPWKGSSYADSSGITYTTDEDGGVSG